VSVAVMSGVFPRGGERLFSARLVGLEGFRRSRLTRVSVFRGMAGSLRMKRHRWMMMGNLCSLVSEVAAIMTVSMWHTLSDMRKGK
jgi:hypothetical protein